MLVNDPSENKSQQEVLNELGLIYFIGKILGVV